MQDYEPTKRILNNKRLGATCTFLKIATLNILENSINTSVAGSTLSKVAGWESRHFLSGQLPPMKFKLWPFGELPLNSFPLDN